MRSGVLALRCPAQLPPTPINCVPQHHPIKLPAFVAAATTHRVRHSVSTHASKAEISMGDAEQTKQQLITLSEQLLQSIADRDWNTYATLCDEEMSCFEPEAVGHLVKGLPFHKFYFDLLAARINYVPAVNTISQPHVRLLGDSAAVVSYVRLQQKIDANNRPVTVSTEETRVWEKKGGQWKNVHFHRSPTTPSG